MLADVRLMYFDGKRLPRDRLVDAPARRGRLTVVRPRGREPIAALLDARLEHMLPALEQVRLARWRGADLVLVGVEQVGRLRDHRMFPQAWWVRLLGPA